VEKRIERVKVMVRSNSLEDVDELYIEVCMLLHGAVTTDI